MTDADTIREALNGNISCTCSEGEYKYEDAALAALDALVAERDEALANLRAGERAYDNVHERARVQWVRAVAAEAERDEWRHRVEKRLVISTSTNGETVILAARERAEAAEAEAEQLQTKTVPFLMERLQAAEAERDEALADWDRADTGWTAAEARVTELEAALRQMLNGQLLSMPGVNPDGTLGG